MNAMTCVGTLREVFAVLQKLRGMYPTLRDDELFQLMFALAFSWERDITELSNEQLSIWSVPEIKRMLKEVL